MHYSTGGDSPQVAKASKKGSKELEQGLLAADSLHKAVMPFVLRRTKDQVLKDLPPKIIQVRSPRFGLPGPEQMRVAGPACGARGRPDRSCGICRMCTAACRRCRCRSTTTFHTGARETLPCHDRQCCSIRPVFSFLALPLPIECTLTALATSRCSNAASEIREGLSSISTDAAPHVFQAMQYLRKLCSHPALAIDPRIKEHREALQRHCGLQGSFIAAAWCLNAAAAAAHETFWFSGTKKLQQLNSFPCSDGAGWEQEMQEQSLSHAPKLQALKDILCQCQIGNYGDSAGGNILAIGDLSHQITTTRATGAARAG